MNEVKLDTRELDRIVKDLGYKPQRIVTRLAFQVLGRSKQFAPVDTGALRNSGFTEAAIGDKPAIVGYTMNYAPFVELGTRRMGARPYLMPALETVIAQFNSGETWRELTK